MPVAVSGSGIEIVDADGKRYLDASGGAAVSCLGHGHPDVLAAMHKQLDALAYSHTAFFTTEVAERLADRLIEDAPAGLSHVYLVSGGSEAIEAALKMARQYFVEIGEPERRHVIARRQSYHGNTLGALAVGGNAWRRAQFEPLLIKTHHIDPCYAYRLRREDESNADYAARSAQALGACLLNPGEMGFEPLKPVGEPDAANLRIRFDVRVEALRPSFVAPFPRWRSSAGCECGQGRGPPLGELQDIVGEADEAPLVGDLLDAAQEKLTEAARLLDLSEHRLGQLLS